MKLLFDQNLSPKLVSTAQDSFPGSKHVQALELGSAADSVIWEYAKQNGFTIVTKDAGFLQRSMVHGHPPRVIWIGSGNCATQAVADLLKKHYHRLRKFGDDAESS
ncbi:MAG: DUF5615 family PIN-like protein, partial [Terriglobales bacterium]